jgi:hypothetical protein
MSELLSKKGRFIRNSILLVTDATLAACQATTNTPFAPTENSKPTIKGTLVEQGVDPNFQSKAEAICDAVDPNSTPIETFVVNKVESQDGKTVSTVEFADCYTGNGPVLTYNSNGEAMTTTFAYGLAGANNTIYDNLNGKLIFDYNAQVNADGTSTITYIQPEITVNVQQDPNYNNEPITIVVGEQDGDGGSSKPLFLARENPVVNQATSTEIKPTMTLEPTATATEAPVQKETLSTFDEWNNFFQNQKNENGQDLMTYYKEPVKLKDVMFNENLMVIAKGDAESQQRSITFIKSAPKDQIKCIFGNNEVRFFATIDESIKAIQEGKTVVWGKTNSSNGSCYSFTAQSFANTYSQEIKENPNYKPSVKFVFGQQEYVDGITATSITLDMRQDIKFTFVQDNDGRYYTPFIPNMPPNMVIGTPGEDNFVLVDELQGISNGKYWLDDLLALKKFTVLGIQQNKQSAQKFK